MNAIKELKNGLFMDVNGIKAVMKCVYDLNDVVLLNRWEFV